MVENYFEGIEKLINSESEKKRKEIIYVANLINQDFNKFNKVFNPDKKVSPEELPKHLYDNILGIFKEIEESYEVGFGIHTLAGDGKPKFESIQLNWEKFVNSHPSKKEESGKNSYRMQLTSLGLSIVNGLREIQGKVGLKEQVNGFYL